MLFMQLVYAMTTQLLLHTAIPSHDWTNQLKTEIKKIDDSTPGNIGVYIKKLSDGTQLNYQTNRKWYFASTVKVPIAIVLLKEVEATRISLTQEITLQKSDYVDGGGEMLWLEPGTKVTVGKLLEKMLTQSDSTAADMILKTVGENKLNEFIHEQLGLKAFGHITSLLQVRYDAYGEVHPNVGRLTNMDFIELKKFKTPEERFSALVSKLAVPTENLRAKSLEEAFERYYQHGTNSGSLVAYGKLLEKIERRQILSPKHCDLILHYMETMTTGENRIKAGLPPQMTFAQKTGTQFRRMCNMGILKKKASKKSAYVVTACLEKFIDESQAEEALKKLGLAIAKL